MILSHFNLSLIMNMTLAALPSVSSVAKGEPRTIYLTPIKVVEGDDVTLQWRLDPPVDVSAYAVDCKKDKGVVHVYRHRQDQCDLQMDQYRNRTHLNHEDLNRGVLNLTISSVRPSDSGQYRCFVSKLRASVVVDVIVVGKDQQNETERDDSSTTGPPEEEVTEPDDRDAAKMEASWKIPVVVAAAAVVVVIFILVKRGKIQICKRRLRGAEMQNLRTESPTEAGEDPDGAAENGLGAAGIAREQTDARVLVGHEEPGG